MILMWDSSIKYGILLQILYNVIELYYSCAPTYWYSYNLSFLVFSYFFFSSLLTYFVYRNHLVHLYNVLIIAFLTDWLPFLIWLLVYLKKSSTIKFMLNKMFFTRKPREHSTLNVDVSVTNHFHEALRSK